MDVAQQTLSIAVVFALLGCLVWLLRRKGAGLAMLPRRSNTRIVSEGRLILTPQHALHVVRWNGSEILVATHPQGCTVLNGDAGKQTGVAG